MSLPVSLVIRLLSLFLEGENIAIYEGRLPSSLAELPLPENTHVAVAFVREEHEEDFLTGAALDTPSTPEAFMTQATEGLEENGWERFREQFPTTGLLFTLPGGSPPPLEPDIGSLLFTKGDFSLTLSRVEAKPGQPTQAFLRVERAPPPPPEEIPSGRLLDLLPLLTAPEGSSFGVGLTVGGEDYVSGNTTVTTGLAPGELAEHLTSQLETAGWRVTERLLGERAALVVLDYSDGKWTYDAQFSVFHPAGQAYSDVKLEATHRSSK